VELKDPLPVLQLMSLPFQTQLTNAKEQLKQKKKVFFDPTKTTTLQLCCCKSVQSGYQG
jgi:hypothetical protein